ncbi:Glycoside hydrolase, subgroup, catalytic core, partial [Metarhizium majus ARSEF 297]
MKLPIYGLFSVAFVLHTLSLVLAQGCSESNPCQAGCCSKYGFCGLGPDYCAESVCVANCDRKAQCDPGGYGAAFVNHTTCPLNVCCSKWGFCGMTDEFCGIKRVKQPSCSSSKSLQRVVGYYEGWAQNRRCNDFYPEQIPVGVYTHLNYAFATINPDTFEIVPAAASDPDMYVRLTNLKWRDPKLKVFIAVGGWTFNDEGQKTRTTFSDLAKSGKNQEAFIKSLISFMSTYNFDGVDLDWEYPEAPDRGGIGEDYDNFPKFLAKLKKSLKTTGGRDGVSITLPASYWYLQHFDIKKLVKHVNFFNIMSYDIHGVWDIPNQWTGPYLNAHTNLTEIKDALDLLWRNNIDPEKVTMGLAFYGRGFRANDPNCLEPGCTYGSGSQARRCSHEVGVLLNSEIVDMMQLQKLQPTHYKDAAVKVLTFDDNQWVAFDDEETLGQKVQFASSKCLGGVMVWAVSHDTQKATFSKALARKARLSRPSIMSLGMANGPQIYKRIQEHKQCLWANCGDSCPAGYTAQRRSDSGARTGEYMLNDSGCHNKQLKVLCCPSDEARPLCGWYNHNNGNCNPSCPADAVEVGSTTSSCGRSGRQGKKKYQAACCSKNTRWRETAMLPQESLRLVSQCSWGSYPFCDFSCSSGSMLVSSLDGSGGGTCWGGGLGSQHTRPLCCHQPDTDWKYTDCQWYRDIGAGSTASRDCRSGCPADKVQVALSSEGCRAGSWSYCCNPVAQVRDKQYDRMKGRSEGSESCGTQVGIGHGNTPDHRRPRQDIGRAREAFDLAVSEIWTRVVVPVYPYLTVPNIRDWINGNVRLMPADPYNTALNLYLLCRLGLSGWNHAMADALSRQDKLTCTTTSISICDATRPSTRGLDKRARHGTQWSVTIGGVTHGRSGQSQPYRTSNDWSILDALTIEIYGQVFYFPARGCTNFVIRTINEVDRRRQGPINGLATEHQVEVQTLARWYEDAMQGLLSGGGANPAGAIDALFFDDTVIRAGAVRMIPNPPGAASGGADLWTVEERLYNALGSTSNDGVFVLADEQLNCLKAVVWACKESLIQDGIMKPLLASTDPVQAGIALTQIRNVVSIFTYLNHGTVHSNMATVIMDIRRELRIAERVHAFLFPGQQVALVDSFTNWMSSHFTRMHTNMDTWVTARLDLLEAQWRTNPVNGPAIMSTIGTIRAEARARTISTQGFFLNV